ncbi:MAG: hypothetical protein K2Y01_05460 [Rhabdochlamydiaceae bacterium]|nr:hypothetical protein [Rhabdochlamydiaceae bacterium]
MSDLYYNISSYTPGSTPNATQANFNPRFTYKTYTDLPSHINTGFFLNLKPIPERSITDASNNQLVTTSPAPDQSASFSTFNLEDFFRKNVFAAKPLPGTIPQTYPNLFAMAPAAMEKKSPIQVFNGKTYICTTAGNENETCEEAFPPTQDTAPAIVQITSNVGSEPVESSSDTSIPEMSQSSTEEDITQKSSTSTPEEDPGTCTLEEDPNYVPKAKTYYTAENETPTSTQKNTDQLGEAAKDWFSNPGLSTAVTAGVVTLALAGISYAAYKYLKPKPPATEKTEAKPMSPLREIGIRQKGLHPSRKIVKSPKTSSIFNKLFTL